jgi:hypothetical protein
MSAAITKVAFLRNANRIVSAKIRFFTVPEACF